jgi:hypothetical protein
MTKQEAEAEIIRRWYELPTDLRQTPDDAEAFAAHIAHQFDFHSVIDKEKLLGAWLMRELFRSREAERAKDAADAEKIQAA